MVHVTTSYSPKTFSFEGSKQLLDLCLADSRILYFSYVLESINNFIIELHVLQCLFARGSNKKQRRGRIFSYFRKGEIFISYDNQALLGVISKCGPSIWTLQERPSSPPSVWPRREYTWTLSWKQSLLIYLENCQNVSYSHE